jgi:uncharacterized protein
MVKRHPLITFFVLAYALSWWEWPLHAVGLFPGPILPYGPMIAAFIILALTKGKAGVKALLRSMVQWRAGLNWYAVALGLPAVLYLAAVCLNVLLGAPIPTSAQLSVPWYMLVLAFPLTILEGGALEEPGWRGYALPRLLAHRSALAASLILGAVHAGWHLPLYVATPANLAYIPLVIGWSVLFTWLFNGTNGSVLLAILFHGSLNTLAGLLQPMFSGEDAVRLFWLLAAAFCVAAVVVALAAGPELSRRPSPHT